MKLRYFYHAAVMEAAAVSKRI